MELLRQLSKRSLLSGQCKFSDTVVIFCEGRVFWACKGVQKRGAELDSTVPERLKGSIRMPVTQSPTIEKIHLASGRSTYANYGDIIEVQAWIDSSTWRAFQFVLFHVAAPEQAGEFRPSFGGTHRRHAPPERTERQSRCERSG
jgi:hypothetical protein